MDLLGVSRPVSDEIELQTQCSCLEEGGFLPPLAVLVGQDRAVCGRSFVGSLRAEDSVSLLWLVGAMTSVCGLEWT